MHRFHVNILLAVVSDLHYYAVNVQFCNEPQQRSVLSIDAFGTIYAVINIVYISLNSNANNNGDPGRIPRELDSCI